MRLAGRVAIVTGGAAGIGGELVRGLAAEGAKVVIADIDGPAAARLAETLAAEGQEALAVATDVSAEDQVGAMVGRALERFGRIDILVNNAAVYQRLMAAKVPILDMSLVEWNRVVSVNLTGVFLCCRAVLPAMISQGSGKIVNIGSAHAFSGTANFIHYVACKGGILGLTRALAREAGPHGITVNCLAPGSILSEGSEDPEVIAMRGRAVPMRAIRRIGYPRDLVGTLVFLASPDSDFVTGQTIVVDGGTVMH